MASLGGLPPIIAGSATSQHTALAALGVENDTLGCQRRCEATVTAISARRREPHYVESMIKHLVTGDRLPALMGKDLDGNEVDITASVAGSWAVIFYYRGDW